MLVSGKNVCGIYLIANCVTGDLYVGKSKNMRDRLAAHRKLLRRNLHENKFMQNSWNKYGEESFEFYVLEECSFEEMSDKEKYYISALKCQAPNGFNLTTGGDGMENPSEETRKKMSEKRKLRVTKDETRILISLAGKGKPKSKEFRENLSKLKTGKKITPKSEFARVNTSMAKQGNGKNSTYKNKVSRYVGVRPTKNKRNPWTANITMRGKNIYLGVFPTEIEAAEAYNKAALEYYGPNAKLNIIEYPTEYYQIDAIDSMYDLQQIGVI